MAGEEAAKEAVREKAAENSAGEEAVEKEAAREAAREETARGEATGEEATGEEAAGEATRETGRVTDTVFESSLNQTFYYRKSFFVMSTGAKVNCSSWPDLEGDPDIAGTGVRTKTLL